MQPSMASYSSYRERQLEVKNVLCNSRFPSTSTLIWHEYTSQCILIILYRHLAGCIVLVLVAGSLCCALLQGVHVGTIIIL